MENTGIDGRAGTAPDLAANTALGSTKDSDAPVCDVKLPWCLHSTASEVLDGSVESRLAVAFADKFILHPDAKRILAALKGAIARPRSERPPGFAVVGPSNSGKTALLNRFIRDFGGDPYCRVGALDNFPIINVRLVSRATEPRIFLTLARSIGLPLRPGQLTRETQDFVLRRLAERQCRMVVFSQFNHIEPIGNQEQRIVFDLLQNISEEGIVVVVVGTEAIVSLIAREEELATRLRPLRLRGFAFNEDFASFLETLETFYPFRKRSYLFGRFGKDIYEATMGVPGEIVMLVNEAAAWAIREQKLQIDSEALQKCNYTPPVLAPTKAK